MADILAQNGSTDPASFSAVHALALTSATVLAGVFIWAGVSKLRNRRETTADFADLGLPQAPLLAIAVPAVELGVAALLVTFPGWGGVAAFGLLALFSANLYGSIRAGSTASCACFGAASRSPVSYRQLWRNAALAALALLALPFPTSTLQLF